LLFSNFSFAQAFKKEANQKTSWKKPFVFVENKGQITDQHFKKRNDIQYKLSGNNIDVFVGNGKLHYQFRGPSLDSLSSDGKESKQKHYKSYRVDMQLVGANKYATATPVEQQTYQESYRLDKTNVPQVVANAYTKVVYKNVYPNIDWILYTRNNSLEYDFLVHPGGRVKDIKLKYKGATKLFSKNNGIVISLPMGNIEEKKPYSYDAATGEEILSKYILNKNTIAFDITRNSSSLIIDPQVAWSTYYGGTNDDVPLALTSDLTGNVYFTGNTLSTSNIATTGAYSTSLHGFRDAFLAKFNSNGQRLWATYFGGTYQQSAQSIGCDSNGYIYIAGSTSSPSNIATSGAYQTSCGGLDDGFLTKFDSLGSVVWSTYYGGSGNDNISSLTIDPKGNVYVAGGTGSTGLRIMYTAGAYDTVMHGTGDMFIAKFRSDGRRVWSTYYGGTNTDVLNNVTTDKWGNIYAVGATQSDSNIATSNGYQTSMSGGTMPSSGFLIKFDSSCHLKWGTYYGNNSTIAQGVVCDTNGGIYISGTTSSTTEIASSKCYQSTFYGGNYDVFLAKFDTAGKRKWGTYYGGTSTDENTGTLSLDGQGNILVSGYTHSTDHISTTNGDVYQATIAAPGIGLGDAFLTKFNPLGQIIWGTYFGSSGAEESLGNCYSPYDGSIYLCGTTTSDTGMATGSSPFQINIGGVPGSTSGEDAFFTKFNPDTTVTINQKYTDTILCIGSTLNLRFTTSYNFNSGNIFTAELSDSAGSFNSPISIGSVASSSSDTIIATIPSGIRPGIGYRIRIAASSPSFKSPDDYYNINILSKLLSPVVSSNSPVCVGDTLRITLQNNTLSSLLHYRWTGPGGYIDTVQNPILTSATVAMSGTYKVMTSFRDCPSTYDSTTAEVNSTYPSAISDSTNSPICIGDTLHLFAKGSPSGITYQWKGPDHFVSLQSDTIITHADTATAGKYYVNITYKGCKRTDSFLVKLNNPDSINIVISSTASDTFCLGTYTSFISKTSLDGVTPLYQWMVNGAAILGATTSAWGTTRLIDGDTIYCVLQDSHCALKRYDTSNYIIATVLPFIVPTVTISAYPTRVTTPGQTITFTATVTNGGSAPTYQWYKNGTLIPGATSNPYATNNVNNGDVMSCTVVSNAQCVSPNTASGSSARLGVEIAEGASVASMYPNPNNGNFTVTADFNGAQPKEATIEVLNVVGQIVYTETVQVVNSSLKESVKLNSDLPNGMYILKLTANDNSSILHFSINK